jgi:hypothetical protein
MPIHLAHHQSAQLLNDIGMGGHDHQRGESVTVPRQFPGKRELGRIVQQEKTGYRFSTSALQLPKHPH